MGLMQIIASRRHASPVPPVSMALRAGVAGSTGPLGMASTTTFSSGTWTTRHKLRAPVTSLMLEYTNPGSASAAPISVACSVTTPDGVLHPATFGGAHSYSMINQDQVHAITDPIAVSLPAGSVIVVRTWYPDGVHPSSALGLVRTKRAMTAGDVTLGGSLAPDAASYSASHHPLAIHGVAPSSTRSVLIRGDSIAHGYSGVTDDDQLVTPIGSHIQYALEQAGHCYVNAAYWATTTWDWGPLRQTAIGGTYTHAICEYGSNNLGAGRTGLQVAADLIGCATGMHAQAPDVYQTTINCRSNSTDGWTTIAGQTMWSAEPERAVLNAWMRDGGPLVSGAPVAAGSADPTAIRTRYTADGITWTGTRHPSHPCAGFIEVADYVESARGSGVFRVDTAPVTNDGVHPSIVGRDLMSAPIRAWAEALTL